MGGVEHKLYRLRQEHIPVRRPRDARLPLPAEILEYNRQAEGEMNAAEHFFQSSGMKLSLFEFNQDMLDNRGRVIANGGFRYTQEDDDPKVTYSSNLGLRWQSKTGTFFTVIVRIEGDLLNTFEIDGGHEDYVKSLKMAFFSSKEIGSVGEQVGPAIQYARAFDIYETPSPFASWEVEGVKTEEEIDKYMEIEEKEGTDDLGGNVYQDWVEANIAGFIRFFTRTTGESPL